MSWERSKRFSRGYLSYLQDGNPTSTGELEVGRVYLLAGGDLLRYLGRAGTHRFAGVRRPPVSAKEGTAPGRPVLRMISVKDRPWLLQRRAEAKFRGLEEEVRDVDFILDELARLEGHEEKPAPEVAEGRS